MNETKDNIYIFKRTERIASAVHMIGGILSDTHPLASEVRNGALLLVKHAATCISNSAPEYKELRRLLCEMSAFLSILADAKEISNMNASLIRDAIDDALTAIPERGSVTFSSEHFIVTPASYGDVSSRATSRGVEGGAVKHAREGHAVSSDRKEKPVLGALPGRHEKIMNILKDKKSASIKDISALITDCSEKTIQRELLSLIQEGRVVRHGERRWSTYAPR